MTKRTLIVLCSLTLFLIGPAVAMAANNGTKQWHLNMIGHPKNVDAIGGDDSNGHAIMIPLSNAPKGKNAQTGELVCETDPSGQTVLVDDGAAEWSDQVAGNARIYFEPGDHFEIMDRDATDGRATIRLPVNSGILNISMRILGKPTTCMDIDGYAYDLDQGLYFWSGRVDLNRKRGKSSYLDISDLFTVYWCQVDLDDLDGDGNIDECIDGTEEELSAFASVFTEYFWNIQNNGVRIVQIKIEHSEN